MPLDPRASVGENIRELHTGKTYARTKKRRGKKAADRQAAAIARSTKRRAQRKSRR